MNRQYAISLHSKMSNYYAVYRVEVCMVATNYAVYMSEWMHYDEANKVYNRLATLSDHELERLIYKGYVGEPVKPVKDMKKAFHTLDK
jgi:hypothetical protein